MPKETQPRLILSLFALTFTLAPSALLAQTPAKPPAPDWCIPGATIEMDFEHNRYFGASLDEIKNKNALGGYAQTKSGLLRTFEPNKLRRTDLGLLIESAQRNELLWSRDLTKDVWVKTNMKAEPAPVGADGKAGGTRLMASADNATVLQTVTDATRTSYGGEDKNGVPTYAGAHALCYIKRVSGTGTVKFNNTEVTALLNTRGYTQVNMRFDCKPTTIRGIQLGTAGEVVDVDMVQFDIEGMRNMTDSFSPFPNTDKVLWRESDSR